MDTLKKVGNFLAPKAQKETDGRDMWPSRTSFVLAAMGGAVGLGNLLRYPSVVFENNGLQWFIPYFISLGFLAIPLLILEISLGQASRGGGVIAFNALNKRARGIGVGTIFTGYVVACYYVPILSWVMNYFRNSFKSPLPWKADSETFYYDSVLANVEPIDGTFAPDGSVLTYTSYPGKGFIGETVGWCAFVWFIVWLCMFRGVGLTGRVVYVTMGLPIVMVIILIGRGASLENAKRGIDMYMGHWDSSQLASGTIWQAAAGQIFFSTGVGFGYFTAFASYNARIANAVQDAVIIGCSNSFYEIFAAFAVFGVVGYLDLKPEAGDELGTFTVGFLTYPEAVANLPASQFWAVIFFVTIMLVGISSAFALIESVVTLIVDCDWAKKVPRPVICTVVAVISFLLSLMFCTEFGYYLLDAVDTWANNFCLLFMAWSECIAVTTLYRYRDVIDQVGLLSFVVYNFGYLSATMVGLGVAHSVGPKAGAGAGFGLFVAGSVLAIVLAKTPAIQARGFWNKNLWLSRFWWVAFYSGNQLKLDLNTVVGRGKNWNIPVFWAPVLKYISAPILAIIVAFAYPDFHAVRNNPLHIFAFSVAHLTVVVVTLGLIIPRALNFIVPLERRNKVGELASASAEMEQADYDAGLEPTMTGKDVDDRVEHGEKMSQ